MEIVKLHDKIHIYRGVIENPQQIIDSLESKATWDKWWIFGKMAQNVGPSYSWSEFPSQEDWDNHLSEIGVELNTELIQEILAIKKYFYIATNDYIKTHGIELDNWVMHAPSFNVYIPNEEEQPGNTSMSFHTDWQEEKKDARGDKFRVTCTMYLNDNYEGGELAFVVTDTPSDTSTYQIIKYKPVAGDIVVFPSTPPFHHGVTKLVSGDRYIVRTFWLEYFPGTPEWLAGEAAHTEEEWQELEKAREQSVLHTMDRIQDYSLNL